MVNWKLMAYDVLLTWADIPSTHTSDLHGALEKTNPEAARRFREVLSCGKTISLQSSVLRRVLRRSFSPTTLFSLSSWTSHSSFCLSPSG